MQSPMPLPSVAPKLPCNPAIIAERAGGIEIEVGSGVGSAEVETVIRARTQKIVCFMFVKRFDLETID